MNWVIPTVVKTSFPTAEENMEKHEKYSSYMYELYLYKARRQLLNQAWVGEVQKPKIKIKINSSALLELVF